MYRPFTLAVLLALAACGKSKDPTSPTITSGVSAEKYNELVNKYNSLVTSSHAVQVDTENEQEFLLQLDATLRQIAALNNHDLIEDEFQNSPQVLTDRLKNLRDQIESANRIISALERKILARMDKLHTNAYAVYKEPGNQALFISSMRARFVGQGQQLAGLRALINQDVTNTTNLLNALKSRLTNNNTTSNLPNIPQVREKQVELNTQEVQVARVSSTGGVTRDENNQIITFSTLNEAVTLGSRLGLDVGAINHGHQMSSQTGGIMGLAKGNEMLTQTITDIMGHVKNSININSADLELNFAIDYSGSMGDDIEAVITNLQQIVDSLAAVQRAGRNVKVSIVTFGQPGREMLNLQLTNNMVEVKEVLQTLLYRYNNQLGASHSIDPGEASFHGLKKAINEVRWSSINRKIILITDEESYEISTNDTRTVQEVMTGLKQHGIEASIYTIVVGN